MSENPITFLMVNEYPDYIDAQAWSDQLRKRLPALEFRIWPDCGKKSDITVVLIDKGASPDFFADMANLRAVVYLGAGVDGLDLKSFPRNVPLIRLATPEQTSEIVQYIVLRVLCWQRHVAEYTQQQAQRQWRPIPPRRISQTRIAIMGAGRIGGWAARSLSDFGYETAVWSRSRKAIPSVESFCGHDQLGELLEDRDYVVCCLPLTRDTKGILNAKTFSLMKKGAYLINVGRGAHVIEEDLSRSLDNGQLSGACLDVFEAEPLSASSPLWAHPKVSITPHVASFWVDSGIEQIADLYNQLASSAQLPNRIDLEHGY